MKPDLDLIRSLTDALDESLGGLRELLDDIDCAISDECNSDIAPELKGFAESVRSGLQLLDDAADRVIIQTKY